MSADQLLLPLDGIEDPAMADARKCVERIRELLKRHRVVVSAHLVDDEGKLDVVKALLTPRELKRVRFEVYI